MFRLIQVQAGARAGARAGATGYSNIVRARATTNAIRQYTTKPKSKSRKVLKTVSGVFLGLGLTGYAYDRYYNSSTLARSARALYAMGSVGLKYYFMDRYPDQNALHESASETLFNMLMINKGIYIKFGQAIANQGSVFPVAYQKRFTRLYDEAPCDSWESVDTTLKQAYGEDYETKVFATIDHEPIASASIAQVHKATLMNGDAVAVKVQHHYIADQVAADLMCYRIAVQIYEKVFDIPMAFYSKYVSDQTLLETKFVHELENAETLRKHIDNDASAKRLNVYIPQNYKELTTEKVLISEWIDGIPLTKRSVLIDQGFNLTTLMNQFITIFSKQIFKYGFIHSDPHPGNMLVRMFNGKQQLVILDHGLYVDLPEKFRIEYCQLWKYLFSFDITGVKRIGQEWGINGMEMFATSIQLKPVDLGDSQLKIKKGQSQRDMMKEFLSDTTKLPLELLFLGRTMRIIQTCNKHFGSPVNRINSMTDEALNSLITKSSLREFFNLIILKTTLFVSTMVFLFYRTRQVLKGDKYGFKHQGLEDEIEKYFKSMAKEMGGVDMGEEELLIE